MKIFCYLTRLNTLFIVLAKPHWHLKYIMPSSHLHYLHHMTSCLKNKVLDVVQEQNSDFFRGGSDLSGYIESLGNKVAQVSKQILIRTV